MNVTYALSNNWHLKLDLRNAPFVERKLIDRNEAKVKKLELNLKNYERANAAKISENIAFQKEQLKKRVRSIVEVEKTFYEAVENEVLFSLHRNENYLHPLQRIYASFFTQDGGVFMATECKVSLIFV
ncbi:hypothetical protein BdWA1_003255 [Babesia duncani]|uniref:Uncharacterized protein n=1 Tax=Babesia duncani TaxID=323732 RepID=A0AAD9UN01_9APIC|nr:hypothetical protein BdWA1_003255 [Babesia duncani]